MKILLVLAAFFSVLMASNPHFGLGVDSLGEQNEQTQNEKRFSKREETARQAIENADYDAAYVILSPLCEEGDAMSCAALGSMYFSGLGTEKDYEKAEIFGAKDENKIFRLYEKGCELGSEAACNNLGLIYESRNDLKKSINLYAKACRKFDGAGCYNYGRMMHDGLGTERDFASARKAFDTSCYMKNALGCYALGYVYEHAQGVDFAVYDAYDGYSRACKLGNDDGCRALGFENYKNNVEIYERLESLAEGCKFGNDSDCKLLKARIAEF